MTLPELISVEDFFTPPARTGATISPDGTAIAYLAPWRNRLNVWIQDLDAEAQTRCVTADETRSVQRFHWTDDPRWLLYTQDGGGDEQWHLYRVDLDDPGAPAVDLTPFPGVTVALLELPTGRPGKALLHLNKRKVEMFDLCELDLATGDLTVLAENPGPVAFWMCGPDGCYSARTRSWTRARWRR